MREIRAALRPLADKPILASDADHQKAPLASLRPALAITLAVDAAAGSHIRSGRWYMPAEGQLLRWAKVSNDHPINDGLNFAASHARVLIGQLPPLHPSGPQYRRPHEILAPPVIHVGEAWDARSTALGQCIVDVHAPLRIDLSALALRLRVTLKKRRASTPRMENVAACRYHACLLPMQIQSTTIAIRGLPGASSGANVWSNGTKRAVYRAEEVPPDVTPRAFIARVVPTMIRSLLQHRGR